MSTYTILAEEVVSMSDLKTGPGKYFKEHPVAVMSNNKPKGYLVSADMFERLVAAAIVGGEQQEFSGLFNPSSKRLKELANSTTDKLLQLKQSDIGEFKEW